MQPERIKHVGGYSVAADSWALGLTLMELAIGKFPFPPDGKTLLPIELLQFIVNGMY